ncbi:MAG: Lysophospholipase, alpha-beta hydrolase superfamily, partial [Pseudomonadota bacterium]|nr:Lysophospholipase, alpha-beta hydrolase superfamily [Pseudomonadota bacterium]
PRARTLRYYEGLFHEVYNEPERDRVIADLAAWIEAHR